MNILGICTGGHDSSAALLVDGEIACAITEERLDRIKHSRAFPWKSIEACLKKANLKISDIDSIALGWNFKRFIKELYLKPAIEDINHFQYLKRDAEKLSEFLNYENKLREGLSFEGPINHHDHHKCHIAYSFHTSGFDESNIMSLDGYGEKETTLIGHAKGKEFNLIGSTNFPDSLGLAYAALTYYLGFKHHCDEGIVMGLASYGNPESKMPESSDTYLDVFRDIIKSDEEANFKINFEWLTLGLMKGKWVTEKFKETFGPVRVPDSDLTEHHMNIASAIQRRTEEVACELAKKLHKISPSDNLCLSGGVALNCVMNTKIHKLGIYKNTYIPSAPADNGNAIGACILDHLNSGDTSKIKSMQRKIGLGPEYSEEEINSAIKQAGVTATKCDDYLDKVAQFLNDGKIIGWYQGRSEFGPRALGNRSILTRPFPVAMKDTLNARVKFREYFRPFAPVILKERVEEFFELDFESPYMMHAVKVKSEYAKKIAATVHVDNTCRVQTVTKEDREVFYELITKFEKLSGVPVVLNTSFNVKGQPIVETPLEAIESFLSTNIDILVLGSNIITKE